MKNLILFLFILVASSCVALEVSTKISFDELVMSTSKYDEKEILIAAFVTLKDNNQ